MASVKPSRTAARCMGDHPLAGFGKLERRSRASLRWRCDQRGRVLTIAIWSTPPKETAKPPARRRSESRPQGAPHRPHATAHGSDARLHFLSESGLTAQRAARTRHRDRRPIGSATRQTSTSGQPTRFLVMRICLVAVPSSCQFPHAGRQRREALRTDTPADVATCRRHPARRPRATTSRALARTCALASGP